MFKKFFLSSMLFCGVLQLWSQTSTVTTATTSSVTFLDEVIISDSRFGLKRSQSGRFVVRIGPEVISQSQGLSVGQLLTTYAGIDILGNRSYLGQNLTTSIRGGRNKNVLILVDGVRMSDPAQISNHFDLNFVDLSQVESIEVIKGAASTLYGSSAAAGVINILTKKGSARPQLSLRATTGSVRAAGKSFQPFSSREFGVNSSGALGNENWTYALGVSHAYADGMSAVAGSEVDPFERTNVSFRLNSQTTENFNWQLSLDKNVIGAAYDNTYPAFEDAPNTIRTHNNRISLSPKWTNPVGILGAQLSYQDTYRIFESAFDYETQSQFTLADLYQKWVINSKTSLLTGFQYQKSESSTVESQSIKQSDWYVQGVYTNPTGLQLHAGARYNRNENYGNHWSLRFNPSLKFNFSDQQLQLGLSYNTAFIAPSLYQVYNPTYGNEDLEPETTENYEVQLQWAQQNDYAHVNFFHRKEESTVLFINSGYFNSEANIDYQGVELQAKKELTQRLSTELQYTYIETDGGNLFRIPKHALFFQLNAQIASNANLRLSYQHQGSRQAVNGNRLSPYALIHLGATKDTRVKGLQMQLNIRNLFDQDYVEALGYPTRGRQVLFGLTYALQ